MDKMIYQAKATTGQDRRLATYKTIAETLWNDVPRVHLKVLPQSYIDMRYATLN